MSTRNPAGCAERPRLDNLFRRCTPSRAPACSRRSSGCCSSRSSRTPSPSSRRGSPRRRCSPSPAARAASACRSTRASECSLSADATIQFAISCLGNGWQVTNLRTGDSLTVTLNGKTWDLQWSAARRPAKCRSTQNNPTSWQIQFFQPPGSLVQAVSIENDPNLGWVVSGTAEPERRAADPDAADHVHAGGHGRTAATTRACRSARADIPRCMMRGPDGNIYSGTASHHVQMTSNHDDHRRRERAGQRHEYDQLCRRRLGAHRQSDRLEHRQPQGAHIVLSNPPTISTGFGPMLDLHHRVQPEPVQHLRRRLQPDAGQFQRPLERPLRSARGTLVAQPAGRHGDRRQRQSEPVGIRLGAAWRAAATYEPYNGNIATTRLWAAVTATLPTAPRGRPGPAGSTRFLTRAQQPYTELFHAVRYHDLRASMATKRLRAACSRIRAAGRDWHQPFAASTTGRRISRRQAYYQTARCAYCNGTGMMPGSNVAGSCPVCHGWDNNGNLGYSNKRVFIGDLPDYKFGHLLGESERARLLPG